MTEAAVKGAVHRMRQRHGELLREEIAQTVTRPEEINEELQHFRALLGKGSLRARQRRHAIETQRAAALSNDAGGHVQTGHWLGVWPGQSWRRRAQVRTELLACGGHDFVEQGPGMMSRAQLIGLAKPLQG